VRRRFVLAILACIAFAFNGAAQGAGANEHLTLVVGFAAGGTSSTAARFIAESFEGITGTPTVILNKPGAGGKLAADFVEQEQSSRTLLFMSSTSLLDIPPTSALTPIGMVATFTYVAAVRNGSPPTVADYMNAARDPNTWPMRNVGTAGSIPRVIGTQLFKSHGSVMVNVPYNGSGPAIRDVLGGHVAMAIVPYPDVQSFKGSLTIIAETGSGIEIGGWIGIYAPQGTPPHEIARLADIFRQASERSKSDLERAGFRQEWRPAADLERARREDYGRLKPAADALTPAP